MRLLCSRKNPPKKASFSAWLSSLVTIVLLEMRRGVGVAGIKQQQLKQDKLKKLGNEIEQVRMENVCTGKRGGHTVTRVLQSR